MNKSYFFAELAESYDAELQDLLNDSEGNSALKLRLKEKRQELAALVAMIEFSPEIVVPVFYDAFTFPNAKAMQAAVACEPDDGDFPSWDVLSSVVTVAPWAAPYVQTVLGEPAGEAFMVQAACLEFLRQFDAATPSSADDEAKAEKDDEGDDDDEDLAEAGDDWMGEQGFDSIKS
jgi:hypothetical protein